MHSPCYAAGQYLPEECPPCSAIIEELRTLPVGQVRESAAWSILREHLGALTHAAMKVPHRMALEVPSEVAAWFPSAGSGNLVTPPIQHEDRGGQVPAELGQPGDGLASHMEGFGTSVAVLREAVQTLVGALPRLSGLGRSSTPPRSTSGSPRVKRPRLASDDVLGSGRALAASLVDPGYDDVDDSDGYYASEFGDSAAEWDLPPPSERLGWKLKPDSWVVREEDKVLVGYFQVEDGSFQPLVNMEFRRQIIRGVESIFYRVRVPPSDSLVSAKELVRRLSYALPNLAARVEGSPAAKPSLVPKKGGRFGLELVVKNSGVPSLVSWSDLPALWAIRASGDQGGPRATDDTQLAARPLRLDWEPGTSEQATISFLRGETSGLGTPPSSLQKPSPAAVSADKEARAQGLRLFSVLKCLEMVSSFLDAAVVMPQEWSHEDYRSFISTVAEAVKGSAAMLAPLVRDKVQEAVFKRVSLREAAVPKALSSVKLDLVNLEPLSPLPYGSLEGIAAILRSRPPPAQLMLKAGLEDLLLKQSRSSQGSGSRGRSSSGQKGRGGKAGSSYSKDSSSRGQDSSRDTPRSASPHRGSFRGSGRGKGKQGGSGSSGRHSGGGSSSRGQN